MHRRNKNSSAKHTSDNGSWFQGFKDGIAVALGYFAVSFSFGILAVSSGLSWWQAVLVSATNLTSAGQVAGLSVMSASGGIVEMIVSQLVINLRYGLMGISLSQLADKSVTTPARFGLAFGITDEIFGAAMGRGLVFGRSYYLGLMTLPIVGWTSGTFLGAVGGNILPEILVSSLTIGIYAMFVSIVLTQVKKDNRLIPFVLIAAAMSAAFFYLPRLNEIPVGFSVIICAVTAAALGAVLHPTEDSNDTAEERKTEEEAC